MNRIIESHHLCIDAVMIDDSMIRMAHIDILSTPLGVRRVCIINNNLLVYELVLVCTFWRSGFCVLLLYAQLVCIRRMPVCIQYSCAYDSQYAYYQLVCIINYQSITRVVYEYYSNNNTIRSIMHNNISITSICIIYQLVYTTRDITLASTSMHIIIHSS